MTYQVERGSVAICALQAAGEGVDAEGTAHGAKGEPAEGGGVVLG